MTYINPGYVYNKKKLGRITLTPYGTRKAIHSMGSETNLQYSWERDKNFYWGGWHNDNKICWVGWDILYQRKVEDGLGLKKINFFNQILLAKQQWNLITNLDSLLARILKALYNPETFFTKAKAGYKSSLY